MKHWNFKIRLLLISIVCIQVFVYLFTFVASVETSTGYDIFHVVMSIYSAVLLLGIIFLIMSPLNILRALRKKKSVTLEIESNQKLYLTELGGWLVSLMSTLTLLYLSLPRIIVLFEQSMREPYPTFTYNYPLIVVALISLTLQCVAVLLTQKNVESKEMKYLFIILACNVMIYYGANQNPFCYLIIALLSLIALIKIIRNFNQLEKLNQ